MNDKDFEILMCAKLYAKLADTFNSDTARVALSNLKHIVVLYTVPGSTWTLKDHKKIEVICKSLRFDFLKTNVPGRIEYTFNFLGVEKSDFNRVYNLLNTIREKRNTASDDEMNELKEALEKEFGFQVTIVTSKPQNNGTGNDNGMA